MSIQASTPQGTPAPQRAKRRKPSESPALAVIAATLQSMAKPAHDRLTPELPIGPRVSALDIQAEQPSRLARLPHALSLPLFMGVQQRGKR